jgi:hypothetical protein
VVTVKLSTTAPTTKRMSQETQLLSAGRRQHTDHPAIHERKKTPIILPKSKYMLGNIIGISLSKKV